jgi:hypothetical protein
MRWSDTTWQDGFILSAITEHKGTLFRVRVELPPDPVVSAGIIDGDGLCLFACELQSARRSHRHIKRALREWLKMDWIGDKPERVFDWFPARAMRLGLDTVLAKYKVEQKKRTKRQKESARFGSKLELLKLGNTLQSLTSVTAIPSDTVPKGFSADCSPRRIRRIDITRPQRKPLIDFDGQTQIPEQPERAAQGAYDRLRENRSIRWQVYVYVCEELSQYRKLRDKESFCRFLALINSFWQLDGVRFWHVPGNPDSVTVEIWPNYDQAKAEVTLDLKGIV